MKEESCLTFAGPTRCLYWANVKPFDVDDRGGAPKYDTVGAYSQQAESVHITIHSNILKSSRLLKFDS
jgi:hypothetical protein